MSIRYAINNAVNKRNNLKVVGSYSLLCLLLLIINSKSGKGIVAYTVYTLKAARRTRSYKIAEKNRRKKPRGEATKQLERNSIAAPV